MTGVMPVAGSGATSSAITIAVPRRKPYGEAIIRPTRIGISQSEPPLVRLSMISATGSGRPAGGDQSPSDDRGTRLRSALPMRVALRAVGGAAAQRGVRRRRRRRRARCGVAPTPAAGGGPRGPSSAGCYAGDPHPAGAIMHRRPRVGVTAITRGWLDTAMTPAPAPAGHPGRAARAADALATRLLGLPAARTGYRRTTERVPMRDGVVLLADHFVPDTATRWAPSWSARRTAAAARSTSSAAAFSRPAATTCSCRAAAARSAPAAVFEPMAHEAADGQDTVEWLRTQPLVRRAAGHDGRLLPGLDAVGADDRPAAGAEGRGGDRRAARLRPRSCTAPARSRSTDFLAGAT